MKSELKRFSKKLLAALLAILVVLGSAGAAISVFAEEQAPYQVNWDSAAIPLFEGEKLSMANVAIQLEKEGEFLPGDSLVFEVADLKDSTTRNEAEQADFEKKESFYDKDVNVFNGYQVGTYAFKVSSDTASKIVYFIVNEKNEYNFSCAREDCFVCGKYIGKDNLNEDFLGYCDECLAKDAEENIIPKDEVPVEVEEGQEQPEVPEVKYEIHDNSVIDLGKLKVNTMPVTEELGLYVVESGIPGIPMFVDTKINLNDIAVEYLNGFAKGAKIVWAIDWEDKVPNTDIEIAPTEDGDNFLLAHAEGVYKLTANYGENKATLTLVVNAKDNYEFYIDTDSGKVQIPVQSAEDMPKSEEIPVSYTYEVTPERPIIPMYVYTQLSLKRVGFKFSEDGEEYLGANLKFEKDETCQDPDFVILDDTNKTIAVIKTGIYVLKASYIVDEEVVEEAKVYVLVNEKDDNNFVITDPVIAEADAPAPGAVEYGLFQVKDSNPVLPMNAGYKVNTNTFVLVKNDTTYKANELTFASSNEAVEISGNDIIAHKKGAYLLTATINATGETVDFLAVVKDADETDYTVYFKNFRADGADVSDFTTTIINKNGTDLTSLLKNGATGNYAHAKSVDKKGKEVTYNFAGYVPYDPFDACDSIGNKKFNQNKGGIDQSSTAFTVLNNKYVNMLSNYTVTANMMLYTSLYGGVGIAGRVNEGGKDAQGFVYAPKDTSNTDILGVNYITNAASYENLTAKNPSWKDAIAGSSVDYQTRKFTATFNGKNASFVNSALGEDNAVTVETAKTAAGSAAIVTRLDAYNYKLYKSKKWRDGDTNGYDAFPIILDFRVTLAGINTSNLPSTKVEEVEPTVDDTSYTDRQNYSFEFFEDTNEIGKYIPATENPSAKVVIPETWEGKRVTGVHVGTFYGLNDADKQNIYEIELSEGIDSVGENAFRGLSRLEKIDFPETLSKVDAHAFSNTGVTELCLPESLVTIGEKAFADNQSLTKVEFADDVPSLKTIGKYAFNNCIAISEFRVPISVEMIDTGAFLGCSSLKKIYVYNRNTTFANDFYGPSGGVDSVLPDGVTVYGATGSTAQKYANEHKLTFISIDDEIVAMENAAKEKEAERDREIAAKSKIEDTEATYEAITLDEGKTAVISSFHAGSNRDAGRYTLPKTAEVGGKVLPVKGVYANAFKDSPDKGRVLRVVLPEGYEYIGDSAFADCENLRYCDMPETLSEIGNYAFANTGFKEFKVSADIASIGDSAFLNCKNLTKLTFAEDTGFKSVAYSIGENAFSGTGIKEVILPINIKNVASKAFENTPVNKVTVKGPYAVIAADAFPDNTVVHIIKGSKAEKLLGELEHSYKVVADVKDEYSAVIDKPLANSFVYTANYPSVAISDFHGKGGKVVVPSVFNSSSIKNGAVSEIGEGAFAGTNKYRVYSVELPSSVSRIADGAFDGCANLTKINFPYAVQEIGSNAFRNCSLRGELTFDMNVTYIGGNAFAENNDLTDVYIYNQACVVDVAAFPKTVAFHVVEGSDTEMNIAAALEPLLAIGETVKFVYLESKPMYKKLNDFKDNKNYTFTIDKKTGSITGYNIKDASKPYSELVEIPSSVNGVSVKTISANLFKNKPYSASISALKIANGVEVIGDSAFMGCPNLTAISLPKTLKTIGNNAFANTNLAGNVVIPASVTKIGAKAFSIPNSKITKIAVENKDAEIGELAFEGLQKRSKIRGYKPSTAYTYYTEVKKTGVMFEAIKVPKEKTEKQKDTEKSKKKKKKKSEVVDEDLDDEDEEEEGNKTIVIKPAMDLTLIATLAAAGVMFLLLCITVVVIIIIAANKGDDDDDDDDDEEDDDEDDEE